MHSVERWASLYSGGDRWNVLFVHVLFLANSVSCSWKKQRPDLLNEVI